MRAISDSPVSMMSPSVFRADFVYLDAAFRNFAVVLFKEPAGLPIVRYVGILLCALPFNEFSTGYAQVIHRLQCRTVVSAPRVKRLNSALGVSRRPSGVRS